jgi:hypothetical protein
MPDTPTPITPQEAQRVWDVQYRPSARSVAKAMTQAARPVHFATVARWKRRGLLIDSKAEAGDIVGSGQASSESPMLDLPAAVTPREAKRVWDSQRRPSSRRVATFLTQTGHPVHFTTVARWKRRDWRADTNPDEENPCTRSDGRVVQGPPAASRRPGRSSRTRNRSALEEGAWP